MIVAYSAAAQEFGPPEVELIELLADQAALAVETTRLRSVQQTVITELSGANAALRRSRAMTEWAEQQHRRLMGRVLDEVGLAGLVTALAETLGASVTVEIPTTGCWRGRRRTATTRLRTATHVAADRCRPR